MHIFPAVCNLQETQNSTGRRSTFAVVGWTPPVRKCRVDSNKIQNSVETSDKLSQSWDSEIVKGGAFDDIYDYESIKKYNRSQSKFNSNLKYQQKKGVKGRRSSAFYEKIRSSIDRIRDNNDKNKNGNKKNCKLDLCKFFVCECFGNSKK